MRSLWRVAALLAIVILAAGCSVTIGGTARPAPTVTPRTLSGHTVKRVLLGQSALSQIVKQPLNIDPRFPPSFGGPETLQGNSSASADNCIGVAVMLLQNVYQDSDVKNIALTTWRPASTSAVVTRVKEGVLSLPTAADAEALFVKFSRQWQRCDGKTVPLTGETFKLKARVNNVQLASSVLAATTSIELDSPNPLVQDGIPAGRAIGVRDNCLIEVEVDFVGRSNLSPQQSGDVNTSALEIAQVMRDKVSALAG
jgi:hypothetical protein